MAKPPENIGKTHKLVQSSKITKNLVQQVFHKGMFLPANTSDTQGPCAEDRNDSFYSLCDNLEENNDELWQTVSTPKQSDIRKKRKASSSPTIHPTYNPVQTQNRFEVLTTDHDANKIDDMDILKQRDNRPPPIMLYGIENINELSTFLQSVIQKDSFAFKTITKQQLRVSFRDIDSYKKAMTIIREKGLIGHTFTRKSERSFRFVIKNLHPTTPIEEIITVIEQTGNKIKGEIINAKFGPDKIPLHTWFVNLEPSSNNNKVKDIQYIFNTKVSIEEPRKQKSVVQCKRCQQYGHTKNNCMRPYRCVKCAESHKTSDCPKSDRMTPATCVLCSGSHPANYKGCKVYVEIQKRKSQGKPRRTEPESNKNFTTNEIHTAPIKTMTNSQKTNTYANVLKQQKYPEPSPNIQTIVELLTNQAMKIDSLLQQLSSLMSLMATVINKITNA